MNGAIRVERGRMKYCALESVVSPPIGPSMRCYTFTHLVTPGRWPGGAQNGDGGGTFPRQVIESFTIDTTPGGVHGVTGFGEPIPERVLIEALRFIQSNEAQREHAAEMVQNQY